MPFTNPYDDIMEAEVIIRKYEQKDRDKLAKLEKRCRTSSVDGVTLSEKTQGDPLCRIRCYPVHVMLVAEMCKTQEIIGVVQGCIKSMGTGNVRSCLTLGCLLGLRVSPRHRRMGIGSRLINSVEDWMMQNGATSSLLATEKTNTAAVNLFTVRSYYTVIGPLTIHIRGTGFPFKVSSQDTKIEKLHIDDAISFYNNKLPEKHLYPMDVDMILKEKLSLGTWICYFRDDECVYNVKKDKFEDFSSRTQGSWIVFSIWNTCKSYLLQMKKSFPSNRRQNLCLGSGRVLSCLKLKTTEPVEEPFGFLLLYGLHGEGPRLVELMRSVWKFAEKVARTIKHCKAITTELADADPLREHLPFDSCTTCIDDLWCLKHLGDRSGENHSPMIKGPMGNVFIDPRDF
ncbi:hypothetical protein MLD38_023598 [Melastoma candidum]|uniref:Uncharacterized protein n=1 Tax=Melastoma candidum TaxID=119954 RepID=A0ACB9NR21_9MYRT|nr:hypothetical protein MLD38_023598 [Melastoma candidum]